MIISEAEEKIMRDMILNYLELMELEQKVISVSGYSLETLYKMFLAGYEMTNSSEKKERD